MYIPKHFNIADKKEIIDFIKGNSFGQLISLVEGRLFSSHIPFHFSEGNLSLFCHVAKRNPQWKNIEGQEVLVTFQGSHDYVSPSWFLSKDVPTWNYQSVHVYGEPKIIAEREKLRGIVNELTGIHESEFEKPWEPEYKDSMLNAIVGIEIKITDIQCKYKLSQNSPKEDRAQIAEEHNKRGYLKLSDATKNALEQDT